MQHKKTPPKDHVIHVRVTKRLKQQAVQLAKGDNRSLSNFIQWLILQEADRRLTIP